MRSFGYGIPVMEIAMVSKVFSYRVKKKDLTKRLWSLPGTETFDRIEQIALKYFEETAASGVHDEGFFVNQTMRAAMLHDFKTEKEFRAFAGDFTEPRNSFAQGLLLCARDSGNQHTFIQATQAELVEKIGSTPIEAIREFIANDAKKPRFHASPRWDEETLRKFNEFLDVISLKMLSDIARKQTETGAYAGFPDLTLWQDGKVRFVEVKGPLDRLTPNQQEAFPKALMAAGADLMIASIVETAEG